jgi:hypothetical protein
MNIIGGTLIGLFLVASPFLFWNVPRLDFVSDMACLEYELI